MTGELAMDTYTKTMVTIITVCVVIVTLIIVGSVIMDGHDHGEGHQDEYHEKLDYIIHRIDELEERLKD